ncbi:UDP-N-acetylglucosamine 4,6-dehydratase [Brevibacterium yomogidense]|uniref:UDP-N-acetylglucosamine 4,6-dehydratase n=1 Tax=Brevibacterium yomogidense TaxID=946573 RepID=A0A1X6X0Z6_9MICO|nr:UDP-N-acetylglucosamine 4,6-dehydratase [Brevibacterium yomogidense]
MARQLDDPGWKACTAQTKMTSSETDSSRAPLRSQTTNRALTGAVLRSLSAGLIYAACIWLASLVRYDFSLSEPNFLGIGLCAAVGLAAFLLLGPAFVYRGRFWKGSGDELIAVGGVLALASAAMYVLNTFSMDAVFVPTSVPVTASALAIVVIGLNEWLRSRLRALRHTRGGISKRALIIGAGSHGLTAYRLITDDPHSEHVAVGFLDDDPSKRYLRIQGARLLGELSDLPRVLEEKPVDVVIIAIRGLPPEQLDVIVETTKQAGAEVRVLPELDVYDLRERGASAGSAIATRPASFRPIEIDDLIGRSPISTDVQGIAGYLDGKTILVTGAGGSIGSHLCKQLARFSPGRVVMTDRDESGLHTTQLVLEGSAMLTSDDLVLGDLRDSGFVRSLVADVKPDIIFHAAALKHLTFLERFPDEAIMTNVGASMSLLDAAVETGVPQFVHISTDKAADPTSVLGGSKYLTERSIAAVAGDTGLSYMSVRFGNVLGSRGSVLGTFVAQAQAGGPVTVTAPGVKRFFMSADEACELVLQAGAIGHPGETLVLDMGEPVRIEDLARRVIALSGRDDVEICYTGLREGEKLEETRLSASETDVRPNHPLISQVSVPPVDLARVRGLIVSARISGHRRNQELVDAMRRIVSAGSDRAISSSMQNGKVGQRSTSEPLSTAPVSIAAILDEAGEKGSAS